MKITQEHYQVLSNAINKAVPNIPSLTEYRAAGMTAKRWRWDLLWAAKIGPWIGKNIYPYANDDHIDTALRKITGTN